MGTPYPVSPKLEFHSGNVGVEGRAPCMGPGQVAGPLAARVSARSLQREASTAPASEAIGSVRSMFRGAGSWEALGTAQGSWCGQQIFIYLKPKLLCLYLNGHRMSVTALREAPCPSPEWAPLCLHPGADEAKEGLPSPPRPVTFAGKNRLQGRRLLSRPGLWQVRVRRASAAFVFICPPGTPGASESPPNVNQQQPPSRALEFRLHP